MKFLILLLFVSSMLSAEPKTFSFNYYNMDLNNVSYSDTIFENPFRFCTSIIVPLTVVGLGVFFILDGMENSEKYTKGD